jgi:hypothetical protein
MQYQSWIRQAGDGDPQREYTKREGLLGLEALLGMSNATLDIEILRVGVVQYAF